MKHILTPILLLVFLFPSLALSEEITMDDLVKRGGIYYKKFTEVPFSGKVTGTEQGSIKNGKREGSWVSYRNNGQLYWKGDYKNGKYEGPWISYYDNGQLKYEGSFKNGKEEGPWVGYNSNGTVWEKYTGTYKNGEKVD